MSKLPEPSQKGGDVQRASLAFVSTQFYLYYPCDAAKLRGIKLRGKRVANDGAALSMNTTERDSEEYDIYFDSALQLPRAPFAALALRNINRML